MANNRMVLVCNVCAPVIGEWQYGQGVAFSFAKWYPGDAYESLNTQLQRMLNEFLAAHSHDGMEHPLRMEYERPLNVDAYRKETEALVEVGKERRRQTELLRRFDEEQRERSAKLGREVI